jgi:hypothetical protein
LKERYFTTPLALIPGRKRSSDHVASGASVGDGPPVKHPRFTDKGKGKGKGGKGKKGNKSMNSAAGCASKTPDGRSICYKYNNQNEDCRKKKCTFLHVCSICFKDHPMYICTPGGATGQI